MIFGSVCSGIEAASVAWNPLGWHAAFFSEIAKFPSKVLAWRFPGVPNYGDMHEFNGWPLSTIDVLCGGTPCQSFSIAGLREGIHDPRGGLLRIFLEVAARYRPRWILWENVPGVRSSDDGRALGTLFGGLGELGYGYAWASLDAQYRGLAQRRERVFVVGCARGWRAAAAVLFDAACMRGDSPPSRAPRERVAGTIAASSGSRGADEADRDTLIAGTLQAGGKAAGSATQQDAESGLLLPIAETLRSHPRPGSNSLGAVAGTLQAHHAMRADDAWGGRLIAPELSNALTAREHKGPNTEVNQGAPLIAHTLRGAGFDASEDGTGRGTPLVAVDLQQLTHPANRANQKPGDPAPTLASRSRQAVIGFNAHQSATSKRPSFDDRTPTLDRSKAKGMAVQSAIGVRRLTPRECERLQGFPDDWTYVPVSKARKRRRTKTYAEIDGQLWRMAEDGPRYAALGNSWATTVVRMIGERIDLVDLILEEAA